MEAIIRLLSDSMAGSGKTYSSFVALGLTKAQENLQCVYSSRKIPININAFWIVP